MKAIKCPKCGHNLTVEYGNFDLKWDDDHEDGGTYQFECPECDADLELHWVQEWRPVVTLDPLHV